jgi:hypothetical protein
MEEGYDDEEENFEIIEEIELDDEGPNAGNNNCQMYSHGHSFTRVKF